MQEHGKRSTLVKLVLVGFMAAILGVVSIEITADDSPKQAGEHDQAAMAAWMKLTSPSEHHDKLQTFVGLWDVTSKFWMDPNAPPSVSAGTSEVIWILDGRFIQENYQSTIQMGENTVAFEGLGLLGYDNQKQQYVGTWADTMSTSLITLVGQFDSEGKIMTSVSQYICPMTGQPTKSRMVSTITNEDEHLFEIFQTGPDGQERKTIEIAYKRR